MSILRLGLLVSEKKQRDTNGGGDREANAFKGKSIFDKIFLTAFTKKKFKKILNGFDR